MVAIRSRNSQLFAVIILGTIGFAVGLKLLTDSTSDEPERGAESAAKIPASASAHHAPEAKSAGGKKASCELPPEVTSDVTVKGGCTVAVKSSVAVRQGATLTIEPGVTLNVDQGMYIWVYDGRLVAKGTEKEPIVMTSANKTKAPGDWVGIGFEDKTEAGTVLDWVAIEYAGADLDGARGAITIKDQRSPKRIAITNTTIRQSALAAVSNESDEGGFAAFEKNTLEKNKSSLAVHGRVLGSVSPGNVLTEPVHVTGDIEETTTWPSVEAPIVVDEGFEIGGERDPVTLTIAPKSVVQFAADSYISVGTKNGGGLVADDVTFTSANGAPHPGDWVGLFVRKRATTVSLDGSTIAYAGADAEGGRGAITFAGTRVKDVKDVSISNVMFKHDLTAAIASSDGDCGPFMKAGNKAEGVPLCRPAE